MMDDPIAVLESADVCVGFHFLKVSFIQMG